MTSTRPYLLRAIYEWCVDQGFTPYIAVAVDERTVVPRAYVKDGQIVLNIGPEAAHQLVLGNEVITLSARFSGVAHGISVPVDRVAAVYARENGHGMAFEIEATPTEIGPAEATPEPDPTKGAEKITPRPHLIRVK